MDEVRHASKREQLPRKKTQTLLSEERNPRSTTEKVSAAAAQNSKVLISSGQTSPSLQDRGYHASLEKISFSEIKETG